MSPNKPSENHSAALTATVFFQLNRKGEFVYINEAASVFLGLPQASLNEAAHPLIIDIVFGNCFHQSIVRAWSSLQPHTFSIHHQITGVLLQVQLHVIDELLHVYVNNTQAPAVASGDDDCTSRFCSEHEALQRLNKIARRVPGVIYQYRLRPDGSSCFPYASDAMKDVYRINPEDVQKDASAVFAILHPDDYEGIVASILESAKKLTAWQYEYRVKFKDGTVRSLQGNAMPQKEADGSVLWHGFITDVTEEKEVRMQLEQAVIDAQEKEWNKIGMELHDNVNQILTTSLLYIRNGIERLQKTNGNIHELLESEKNIHDAIVEIRQLSHILTPTLVAEMNAYDVFRSLIENMRQGNLFQVHFDADQIRELTISPDLQINLYRILQEQFSNISKYAKASDVVVQFFNTGQMLILRIADNGKGFDPLLCKAGIGFENMKRRSGVFSGVFKVKSAPGKGCVVEIEIPFSKINPA